MMHISSSLPGGGTSPKSDKIVWSRERGGGIGVEVCRLQLHLFSGKDGDKSEDCVY